MGLFDFFKKKSSSEETPIEDGDKTVQMIALQDGKRLMQNLIVYILISPILFIMGRLSSICLGVQIRLTV